jgi:hypothetical protein
MKRSILVACLSLAALAFAAPPAQAGGRFFISFGFGFGGGYHRHYRPYAYYHPGYAYGWYRPGPYYRVAYVPRYYRPIRVYTVYSRPQRGDTVYRNERHHPDRSRDYGTYVPRRYVRQR